MSRRIKIFAVPEEREIPIRDVIEETRQGGFLQLAKGEIIFQITLNPLKLSEVKMNINLVAATKSISAKPGIVYVTGKTKEVAVHRFLNKIGDEKAVEIASRNGFDTTQFHFPVDDAENKKPESEMNSDPGTSL